MSAGAVEMVVLRNMETLVKVWCVVAMLALGLFSPVAANAAPHCVSAIEMSAHGDGHHGGQTDSQRMDHMMKACCLTVCGLQNAVAPSATSAEGPVTFEHLVFVAPVARLTGHPVSPAFEPPRSAA